jgi:FixJ family two-component response regulator
VTAPSGPLIFVVDDDPTMRRALARLLQSAGFGVEAFPSAEAYRERPKHVGLGCLILDVSMPGMDGFSLQEELAKAPDCLPVVFLTGQGDIPSSVRALKRGAVDFLTKPVDEEALLGAVRAALDAHARTLGVRAAGAEMREKLAALSPREREVMRCVIGGALNKQIAMKLGIKEATVKVHRGRVMQKLGASSVADLVRTCATLGIEPEPVPHPTTTKVE